MSSKACFLALNSALNEIKHVCPNIQHAFLFKADAQLVAKDYETDEDTANAAAQAIQTAAKRAQAFGGLESMTFQGANCKVMVTGLNEFYLATIADKGVDEQTLHNLTHVVIPTIVKVLQVVNPELVAEPAPAKSASLEAEAEDLDSSLDDQAPTVDNACPDIPELSEPIHLEPVSETTISESVSASQLMVETLSGLGLVMCSQNVVRVDSEILVRWKSLYGNHRIVEVEVEEPQMGKKLRCRFKAVRNPKLEGKGVIQMSEKLQQLLEIRKGALVTVKPVLTKEEIS